MKITVKHGDTILTVEEALHVSNDNIDFIKATLQAMINEAIRLEELKENEL